MKTQPNRQRPARAVDSSDRQPLPTLYPDQSSLSEAPNDAYQPTDVLPENFFQTWGRKEREALVELLIGSLDAEDPDPDLEDRRQRIGCKLP